MRINIIILLSLLCLATVKGFSQQDLKQGLQVPSAIAFNGKSYDLKWSSNPGADYYKFEYLVNGDSLRRFSNMILLEHVTGGLDAVTALAAKVDELKKLKAADSNVEYFLSENNGNEKVLDFMVTAKGKNGRTIIAERNIYRYINSNGGLILFGYSTRRYDENATLFLKSWKNERTDLMNKFSEVKAPVLKKSQ